MIPIICLTNDKHLWAMRPFEYLYYQYWGAPLIVAGYSHPSFVLNEKSTFVSIDQKNYPAQQWSTGLIRLLNDHVPNSHFILLLEDFFLTAKVNGEQIEALEGFAKSNLDVLRVDLTADRASQKHAVNGRVGGLRMITTPRTSPYQMSFQAGLWNKKLMLDVLRPSEDPWQSEINGTARLSNMDEHKYRVFGTLDYPVRYAPVIRSSKGQFRFEKLEQIPTAHRRIIENMLNEGTKK